MRLRGYSHSGVVTPKGLALGGLFGALGGLVVGSLYGLAIFYNPFIYVSILATIFFGGVVGFVVAQAMKAGHTRNTAVSVVLAVLAAGFAHLVGWIVWLALLLKDAEGFELSYLLAPDALWETILLLNENGVWSIRNSSPVSGTALWVVWGLEVAIVLGAAAFIAYGQASSGVYCEPCRHWCSDEALLLVLSGAEEHAPLERRALDGDLEAILQIPPPHPEERRWITASVAKCEHCGKTNTLTLEEVVASTNKKGDEEHAERTLLDHLLVTREQITRLEQHAEQRLLEGEGDAANVDTEAAYEAGDEPAA